jgi:hypothetical protein
MVCKLEFYVSTVTVVSTATTYLKDGMTGSGWLSIGKIGEV